MQGQREEEAPVVFESSGEASVADIGQRGGKEKRLEGQTGSRSLEICSSSRP